MGKAPEGKGTTESFVKSIDNELDAIEQALMKEQANTPKHVNILVENKRSPYTLPDRWYAYAGGILALVALGLFMLQPDCIMDDRLERIHTKRFVMYSSFYGVIALGIAYIGFITYVK